MKKNLKKSKKSLKETLVKDFYLGPMSKNIVDTVVEFNNRKNSYFGLIPSRRQIEAENLGGGYVNSWSTEVFSKYVNKGNSKTIILRDHSGPMQGLNPDNGYFSLASDILSNIKFLHIDPWKTVNNISDGIELTIEYINYCESIDENIFYEIGTEEAIFGYTPDDLEKIIKGVKLGLQEDVFSKIIYGVVQSGTSVTSLENSGIFNSKKSKEMSDICHFYGLKAKEHNSDYLNSQEIIERRNCGVDSLNIAPELGVIETRKLLTMMSKKQKDMFFKLCYDSGKWHKWVGKNEKLDYEKIALICGHYMFGNKKFTDIKNNLPKNTDIILKSEINKKLEELWNIKK
jgi:hypothetical protein